MKNVLKILLICTIISELVIIIFISFNNQTRIKNNYYFYFQMLSIPSSRSSNNSILIWELTPNDKTYYETIYGNIARLPRVTTIKINSDGFRDREYSIEKPDNTFRIIVLGDSLTFGPGVELNETYSKVLERKLNSLNNGINYEVLNFGVPGYSTKQEVEMFKVKGLKYDPDMVILQYFYNDVEDHNIINKMFERKKENNIYNLTDVQILLASHNEYYNIFLKNHFREIISDIVINPLEDLSTITNTKKINVIILYINELIPEQFPIIEKICNKNHWHLIDTNEVLSKYSKDKIKISLIDDHFTLFGNEIIGEQIYNYSIKNKII